MPKLFPLRNLVRTRARLFSEGRVRSLGCADESMILCSDWKAWLLWLLIEWHMRAALKFTIDCTTRVSGATRGDPRA